MPCLLKGKQIPTLKCCIVKGLLIPAIKLSLLSYYFTWHNPIHVLFKIHFQESNTNPQEEPHPWPTDNKFLWNSETNQKTGFKECFLCSIDVVIFIAYKQLARSNLRDKTETHNYIWSFDYCVLLLPLFYFLNFYFH